MRHIITLLMISLLGNAFSQVDLTLTGAIQLGLEKNYQIRIAEHNITSAQKSNTWGEAGLYPTVSLNIGNNNSIQDNTNNPATFFPGNIFSTSLQGTLDVNWTIFAGLRVKMTKEQLELLEDQSMGNGLVVVENTVHSIILAYFNTIVQQRKLSVLKEVLDYSRERVQYYRAKEEIGLNNSLDVLQFKNQLLSDSTNYLMQEMAYKNAKRNLNLLMAVPIESQYNLTDSLKFDIPETEMDTLRSQMLENNQTMKNQLLNIELQKVNTQIQKSALYPTISLNLGASPSLSYFAQMPDGPSQNGQQLNYYGNLSIRYTLFNNGKNKRAVELAKIREEVEVLTAEETALQLNNELHTYKDMLDSRKKIEDISLENLEYSKRVWDLGKEKYKLGTINYFNLNDLQNTYRNTKISYYDNLYNLFESYMDILRITGGLIQQYQDDVFQQPKD